MTNDLLSTWAAVDTLAEDWLGVNDGVLEEVMARCTRAALPAIAVSPCQGRFLQLLARVSGAKRVLEIGTLGGYSTIWLARALPDDGTLITLELEPAHADVALANFRRAGLSDRIQLIRGVALESLARLAQDGVDDFDLVFIDADKQSCADYFTWALAHTRVGGVIVVDNVVRNGAVVDRSSADESVIGVRRFLDLLASETRVEATAIQTVGSKGYDGFCVARKIGT